MKFYDALQADPAVLKKKIADSHDRKEKSYFWCVIAVRSVLIVAFAVVFIGLLSQIFGTENSPLAVALFCILLSIRFVNFDYCIGDSLVTLAAAILILLFAPVIAVLVPWPLLFFVHFIAFFTLLYITSQRPEMGNGGLYSFAYIYLTGNPVQGTLLWQRAGLALTGYLICGAVLLVKHRNFHSDIRFHQVVHRFSLTNLAHLWQLRLAIGVSLALTIGSIFGIKRFIWMGFACSSLLAQYPYSDDTSTRFWQRIAGVLAGSALFYIIYRLMPEAMHPLMGPLGGLCLGFCTDYRYKTALNCFGALMAGVSIYGLGTAVILRIADTIIGVILGMAFAWVFHKLLGSKFLPAIKSSLDESNGKSACEKPC